VIRVVRGVVVCRVAPVAIGRHGGEVIVHVTAGTGHSHVKAGQWEYRLAMVEHRARPTCGGMACVAGDREARRCMGRIVGRVVIRQMARLAGRVGQRIVIIYVAGRAQDRGVESGKRESGAGVIPR